MSNRLEATGHADHLTCAGLAAIFSGCACLVAMAVRELSNPYFTLTPPPTPLILVPLAVVFAGAVLIQPSSRASAAGDTLMVVRLLAAGALLLAPFVIWLPYVERNVHFTVCSFLAILSLAGFMRQLCEFVRQMFAAKRMHKRAVYAYRGKQFIHFFLVVPLFFIAVMLTFREFSYGVKSSLLAEIVWRNSPVPFRFLVVVSAAGGMLTTMAAAAAAVHACHCPTTQNSTLE